MYIQFLFNCSTQVFPKWQINCDPVQVINWLFLLYSSIISKYIKNCLRDHKETNIRATGSHTKKFRKCCSARSLLSSTFFLVLRVQPRIYLHNFCIVLYIGTCKIVWEGRHLFCYKSDFRVDDMLHLSSHQVAIIFSVNNHFLFNGIQFINIFCVSLDTENVDKKFNSWKAKEV